MTSELAPYAVVMVNYRTLSHVRRAFAEPALRRAAVVVLVDNGSDPNEISALAAEHGAEAVLLPENIGFAAGVNAGLPRVPPQCDVLLLNPDVSASDDALDAMLRALAAGADAVAPVLHEPGGRVQVGTAGGPVTLRSFAAYFLCVSHLLPSVQGIFLTRRQARRADRVAWICFACALLRHSALGRFGRLPEDELVYAEDVAWGTRATAAGARLHLVPDASVVHDHGSSGGSTAWRSSLERLAVRRLGPVRGRAAVACMRLGLALRRAGGRRVSAGVGDH